MKQKLIHLFLVPFLVISSLLVGEEVQWGLYQLDKYSPESGLVLNDGSTWQIKPEDQEKIQEWKSGDRIALIYFDGENLMNIDRGEEFVKGSLNRMNSIDFMTNYTRLMDSIDVQNAEFDIYFIEEEPEGGKIIHTQRFAVNNPYTFTEADWNWKKDPIIVFKGVMEGNYWFRPMIIDPLYYKNVTFSIRPISDARSEHVQPIKNSIH